MRQDPVDLTSHVVVLTELRELPVARHLTPEHLTALAAVGSVRELAAGSVVLREGERTDFLWLVIRGRIALSLSDAAEVRHTVSTVSRGEFFGWTALAAGMFEQGHAEVIKPCRCIGFDAARLRALCEDDSAFGLALMRVAFSAVLHRLYDCKVQLVDLYAATP